jgi:gluconate 2-dehydrogenase alpha chain
MAIDLKKTDVVIVGLGAVGGVAALPLARAGLDVIGIEAGTWLSPRDFAPDELRNNFRGWPQSAQKANGEIPTHRPNASAPYSPRLPIHPMMNAVGGTSLHYWAQSWRLNPWDFRVVSETTRRYGAARIPKGSTVEDWPFGLEELEPWYDKVEYEVGVSGQAGNVAGTIDKRGNIFEGVRAREYPMPALTGTEFTEHMATAARARLASLPRPGRDQLADLRRPPGLPLSRLLQPRRLPHQRQELDRGEHHPQSCRHRTARRGDAGDRDQRRGR